MSSSENHRPEYFLQRALEMGATDAQPISPAQIPTAEWVRLKCQYGCGGYGRRLTCPPFAPTPQQTRRTLDEYSSAILLHSAGQQTMLRELVVKLEREAFLDGYHKAFALAAGPCHLCDRCETDGPCRHPGGARPAMEACGIDVFQTARKAGLPIEVVKDREQPQNYYALLLLE